MRTQPPAFVQTSAPRPLAAQLPTVCAVAISPCPLRPITPVRRRCRPRPVCNADDAPPQPAPNPPQDRKAQTGFSRTLPGRIIVETLSLLAGALLLLVVVVWRASNVVSLMVWRALVWLANVRMLGKWAFGKIMTRNPGPTAFINAARRRCLTAMSQIFRFVPPNTGRKRKPPTENKVLRKDLDNVQKEIKRMQDIIASDSELPEEGDDVVQVMARPEVTTRRMILLRHAKTCWDRESNIPDHDRVLSARGKEEAKLMGSALAERGWFPDMILCSDAVRTVQTLSLLDIPEKEPANTLCTESLYYAVTGDEMAVAVDVALASKGFMDRETLMVICHNPGCEELVEQLTGRNAEMGTACAALLEYRESSEQSMEDATAPFLLTPQKNQWELVDVLRPSLLEV